MNDPFTNDTFFNALKDELFFTSKTGGEILKIVMDFTKKPILDRVADQSFNAESILAKLLKLLPENIGQTEPNHQEK